ncbi:MAG TPA: alpha/beta hydrolase, partial [Actinomycetota bacterium]|nr:alpha/beta hydrolase [Actinomycetota bacterium]
MIGRRQMAAVAAGAGLAAGLVAEHAVVRRRRTRDPERDEPFGERRGVRARTIERPDGARLFVEEAGPRSRRGAVFVHASAMRTDVWHYQLAGLGGHRLVFYDLRGHGRSQPKGDAPFSIPLLADDLVAVIEECGLDEVVLVGHSVGGMVALELCVRHADLARDAIAGLVLANTTYCPAVETVAGSAALTRLERVTRRPLDALGSQSHRIDVLRRVVRPSDAVFWAVAFLAFGPAASAKQIDFTYDML